MLFWGCAAAAPILIHLWNRHRYQEMQWAAMQYLLAAIKKNSRRIRVEQLLVLIVRCLILLLFAMALSDVSCNWSSSLGTSLSMSGTTHTVLVIDGSYSMDYQSGGTSNFEKAKQMAKDIVDSGAQGDGYTLILMSDIPKVIIAEPSYDAADVLREIDQLQMIHSGANVTPALAEITKILEKAKRNHPRLNRNRIRIISDLTKNSWESISSQDATELLEKLSKAASFSVIDVGQVATGNFTISDVQQELPFATIGATTNFNVQVDGSGDPVTTQRAVRMYADDVFVSQQTFDSSADTATLRFSHQFDIAGDHTVEFRLDEDSLSIDNHRWQAVKVKNSLRVLCVAGQPGAAKYLAFALQPDRLQYPTVRPEVVNQSALLELDLLQYDAIMFVNVRDLVQEEAKLLSDYVYAGGGLAFFMGDRVQAENYNNMLASTDGVNILPTKLIGPSVRGNYRFDPREYQHAMLQAFRGQQDGGLLITPIWNYYRTEKPENNLSNVSLWLDSGDPAVIISKPPQKPTDEQHKFHLPGRVAVINIPASIQSVDRTLTPPESWTLFPSWPSFPPVIQELLIELVRSQGDSRNIQVGSPLIGRVEEASTDSSVDLIPPNEQRVRVALETVNGSHQWMFDQTEYSGIYQMIDRSRLDASQSFAVNINTRESDLTRVALEDLPGTLNLNSDVDNGSLSFAGIAGGSATGLFRLLLIMVLLLVLTESILAWRYGTGAA
ncbi:MAG: hypothetical protein COA78_09345 [Blastopirellula sp.]|nr:MAG: hypothetical protein COA78_09345 [Blastopirellula sp.]